MDKSKLTVLKHDIFTGDLAVLHCEFCEYMSTPRKTKAIGQCHFCCTPVCSEHHIENGLEVHLCPDCYRHIQLMFPEQFKK